MKTLKTLALAAAGTVLTVASLAAQTAVGQMQWGGVSNQSSAQNFANGCSGATGPVGANCTTYWSGIYTSPYLAQFSVSNPGSANLPPSPLLPPAGINSFGPTVDIYCVDFFNSAILGTSNVYYTNLGSDAADIGITTRSGATLTKYLEAAYLATQLSVYTDATNQGNINGAIWQIMTGTAPVYRHNGTKYGNSGIASWVANAAANYSSVNAYNWAVVTDVNAAGYTDAQTSQGGQEYLVNVTPEPATLILMGSGLAIMMLGMGYVKRFTA